MKALQAMIGMTKKESVALFLLLVACLSTALTRWKCPGIGRLRVGSTHRPIQLVCFFNDVG